MAQLEVLPVPAEYLPRFWNSVRPMLKKIPDYDIERTHTRLLAGLDQLWIAWSDRPGQNSQLYGAVITTIANRPPQLRKAYVRADKAQMKSLVIHIVGQYSLLSWLDSATERIKLYARQNNCRMLFLLARKDWHRFLYHRWYSPEWELVALSRDRPTYSKCRWLRFRNTPGYFRELIPVPAAKFNRWMYGVMSKCYFKEAA